MPIVFSLFFFLSELKESIFLKVHVIRSEVEFIRDGINDKYSGFLVLIVANMLVDSKDIFVQEGVFLNGSEIKKVVIADESIRVLIKKK